MPFLVLSPQTLTLITFCCHLQGQWITTVCISPPSRHFWGLLARVITSKLLRNPSRGAYIDVISPVRLLRPETTADHYLLPSQLVNTSPPSWSIPSLPADQYLSPTMIGRLVPFISDRQTLPTAGGGWNNLLGAGGGVKANTSDTIIITSHFNHTCQIHSHLKVEINALLMHWKCHNKMAR